MPRLFEMLDELPEIVTGERQRGESRQAADKPSAKDKPANASNGGANGSVPATVLTRMPDIDGQISKARYRRPDPKGPETLFHASIAASDPDHVARVVVSGPDLWSTQRIETHPAIGMMPGADENFAIGERDGR